MKIQTVFGLVGVAIEPPLVALPQGAKDQLSVGTARFDGGIDVIATLNLEGRALSAERKCTAMRLLQLLGEAVAHNDRDTLRVLPSQNAPSVVVYCQLPAGLQHPQPTQP